MTSGSRAWVLARLASAAVLAGVVASCAPQVGARSAPASPWEEDFARFEAADRANSPRPGGVVFVGSSSIRLWSTLASDFPGVPVLNRGFGGSQLADAVRHAERIVVPHRPRLVVVYAGDNDLAAGRTPQQVASDFQALVSIVHRHLPRTTVAFVSVKPSLARWAIVDRVRETNRLVQQLALRDSLVRYLDVFTPMLDDSGRPRPELFQADGLHLTPAGYSVWRDVVAPALR